MKKILLGLSLYTILSSAVDTIPHQTVLIDHAHLLELIEKKEVKFMEWGCKHHYYIYVDEKVHWFLKKSYQQHDWAGQNDRDKEISDPKITLKLFKACREKYNKNGPKK